MYALIRLAKANPGMAGELIRRIEEGFVPTIANTPGLVSYYLVELEDDQLATMPVFESKEAAGQFNQQAVAWIRQNALDLVAGPPVEYMGDVKIHIGK